MEWSGEWWRGDGRWGGGGAGVVVAELGGGLGISSAHSQDSEHIVEHRPVCSQRVEQRTMPVESEKLLFLYECC
jgi:hypothetical protein